MDAIFGIWHLDKSPVQPEVLQRMAGALKVAPGKQRVLSSRCEGPLGFGRLSIGKEPIDQPPTQAGNFLCVSDSRLYRAPDTVAPTDLSAPQRESLLCGLHECFGDEAPRHLEGDFAYALWDKSKQRLTLVRDHIGVRPLFYFCIPGKLLLWASHSDLIMGSGLVADELDLDVVARDLLWDMSDREITLVRGLKRLEPAQILHADLDGQLSKRKYWTLECVDPISDTSDFEECALELRRLLDEAVRRRLPGTERVGAHLSGGLDSASIAVLAARALTERDQALHTYSLVAEYRHDVQIVDERPYVDAIVQRELNIFNVKIYPPEHSEQYIDGARDRLAAYGGDEEKILTAADADAVDIILSGWGGDEIISFNGRWSYAEYFVRGRWRKLWSELTDRASLLGTTRKSVFANEVLRHLVPVRLTKLIRRTLGKKAIVLPHEPLSAFLNPPYGKNYKPEKVFPTSASKSRMTVINNGSIAFRLENWASQGAHHGVQYVFPMLDRQLLEYSIRLPASFFIRHGIGRAIFREAMKGVLPESVRVMRLKLAPQPCHLLRLSEHKAEHRKAVAALRKDPQLAQIFDFDAIEAALEDVPDPDVVKAQFNAEAAGGESTSLEPIHVFEPIMFSKFLQARCSGQRD